MSKKETTIKQDTGLKRDTTDKYYTKLDIVEDCKVQIEKHINIKENDLIIEPSAGNGSFIKIIKELTKNHKFYDLIPENKEIIKRGSVRHIYLGGQKGMLIHIAKCCNPQPGDKVKAYLSRNRAAVLHRISCSNFQKIIEKFPEKIIDASWD